VRKLQASDIRDLNLFKHYRIVRKWACKNNKLNDAELELLIYFDCMGMFTKQDYKIGTYAYSWDNRRWNKLIKDGWIVVYRNYNRTTQRYNIYKVSLKCKQLIARMTSKRNSIMSGKTYIDKVLITAIKNVNKDKNR